ncbi:cytochrome c oxidase assembly factor Coa1 family protein [Undibacterium sp. TS12]|uniref:cytochrome c oxidase assembly factor Coa1 family protein n=1 Tax=Undibacterium sp. TS12 TaxID=2908202 RepID=UPI001F4CE84F|nr:cytochrome c oxidase assembly factor Coa1 family protein [Undibacterium sp. TS12]MCH8622817.1 cytochrome c oxidase assembly factor Coa1 family protein [Undibacterium sp. TS12]
MSNKKHRRISKYFLLGVVITAVTYFAGYYFSSTSEAFGAAKDFILQSAIIQKEVGEITEMRLSPFGYELESTGDQGSAEFECRITGTAKSGKVYVTLKKNSAAWRVIQAKLQIDKSEIPLIQTP